MNRRGVTLTEVLIAILLMAIGMISLLALFPVGIINMQQANRDNQVAKYAANAEAIAEIGNVRRDPTVFAALQRTNLGGGQAALDPLQDEPSVPVWVHPLDTLDAGVANVTIGDQAFIPTKPAATNLPWRGIARSGMTATLLPGPPDRWFAQTDEETFTKSGETVYLREQENKYSWCYVVKRPRYRDPELVELTVVVFINRKPAALAAGGPILGEVTLGGPQLGKVFTAGSTSATIAFRTGDVPPAIKRGFWLFDATVGRDPADGNKLLSNGYFYRVLEVSDPYVNPNNPGETLIDIQMQTPARANGYVCVLLTGVVDVIDKGVGRTPR